jgi:hypothetical protein
MKDGLCPAVEPIPFLQPVNKLREFIEIPQLSIFIFDIHIHNYVS